MGMPAIEHGRWWTADEARQLQQEDRGWPRYEVIDGELLVTPGASWHHQSVSGAFYRRIWAYVNEHRLAVEVLYSPADVQLKPGTLVQPDVFAFPKGKRRAGKWSDVTSLLLAIEIISPGSVRYDRVTKKRFFQDNECFRVLDCGLSRPCG